MRGIHKQQKQKKQNKTHRPDRAVKQDQLHFENLNLLNFG